MAQAVECPNREVNLQMCPCPSEDCERKGVCCLCIEHHLARDGKSYCMRDVERPPHTRFLEGVRGEPCDRQAANLEACACDYEPCGERGTCCDCVRNHWGNAVYPAPACMRA
ncbi:MAG: hypothetical protein ACLF0G_12895 [Candidatus Brocadiia bacterium]